MTIDEAKTEIRKIEKYYDFNHQTNDYDVLVNLTEIANLILLQNKISYNKAIDDFAEKLKSECRGHCVDCDPYFGGGITDSILYEDDIEEIAEQLKAGGESDD